MLGTRSLETAFALMNEANRRAGESGDYNEFIKSMPVPPYVSDEFDFETDGPNLVAMSKFTTYWYTSKSGKNIVKQIS